MRALPYKLPRIIRAKSGDWRIVYAYELPDQPKKFKKFYVRDGINYIHNIEEKESAALELQEDITFALQAGFNPFLSDKNVISQIKNIESKIIQENEATNIPPWTIQEAIDHFLNYCHSKNLKETTIKKYKSQTNTLKKYLEKFLLLHKLASQIDEDLILDFLETSFEEYKWSARTYNNYIDCIVTLFTRLPKLEGRKNKGIKYSIDLTYLEDKNSLAEKNRYYSPKVADLIKTTIKNDDEIYRYVKWIFYSCMRPNEIRLLQVKHIDLVARQIKVAGATGKTGDRFVPICDELHDLMEQMKLNSQPLDFYVFGRNKKPSATLVYDDYFRDRYRHYKVKLGLDNNYTLYSWKHTRVVSLIMAGFDENQIMTLTGHRNRTSFEAYKRNLVIDNTIMKGKTIYI